MLTGDIRSQVDRVWDAFWSGGISNPLEVIEQITYLLFLRRLDDLHTLEENKAARLKRPLERRIFPEGKDSKKRPYADLRWSRFKHFAPAEMYTVVSEHAFPFLRTLGGDDSTYAHHMKDARFTIPTPGLLAKVVDLIAEIPLEDRDTKGDLYEYMLGKIATAGQNGQFRTPRHIIRLMVELTAPRPEDVVCDPAVGTAGFLVAVGEYLRDNHPEIFRDTRLKKHFHHGMFHGFDFDNTMLRIGSMNMLLHGVENPDIRYRDSLSQDHARDEETYTLVLANPPFAGSLDYENTAKDLLAIVKTKKTELLFLTLFLRLLKPGGRAAVIVPDGVLFGSSKAHKELRRLLVEEQKLDAVISLPSGVFKPYAGVSTAILCFTKTNSGGTDHVWFYDVDADGWSLDDKRTPLLPDDKLGPVPAVKLTEAEHAKNNLPDVVARWEKRNSSERKRPRTAQSFCVPKEEIAAQGYDLSVNRYKEIVHEEVAYRAPKEILAELARLEGEIQKGMKELRRLAALEHTGLLSHSILLDLLGEGKCSNWPEPTVQSIASDEPNSIRTGPFGSQLLHSEFSEHGIAVLGIDNVAQNEFLWAKPRFITERKFQQLQRYTVRPGDVLITIMGTCGKCAVAPENIPLAITTKHLCCITLDKTRCLPEYLRACFLGHPRVLRQLGLRERGAVMPGLNMQVIKELRIPLPPLELQREFARRIATVDNLKAAHRASLAELDALFASLQHRAFRGEL